MASFTGPRIVFTAPRTIELQEHAISTSDLGPSDLVIRTIYTLISPGTEGSIYTGENKRVYEPDAWCAYPFNSGYTNIAEVVWCGEDVDRFAVGDHVFTRNKHGAYYVVDTKADVVVPLSRDQVRPETLIARLASISLTAPLVCDRTLGASVLVFGLGNIGNLAAQLYTIGGATVVGVDPNPIRRRIAADVGIAGTCGSDPDEIRQTLASIGLEEKVDIVVDAVGLPDLDIDTVPFTRRKGEYVLLGSPKLDSTRSTLAYFRYVHLNGIRVIGALENVFPDRADDGQISREGNLAEMVRMISLKRLKVEPLLTHVLPFERSREGYEGLVDRQAEYQGVALDWTAKEED